MTATGVLIADRYRVVEHIATGGMGSVWKAWDELLQRPVAVKDFFVVSPIPFPIDFGLSNLSEYDASTVQEISDSVRAMLKDRAHPARAVDGVRLDAQTIYESWVSAAVLSVLDDEGHFNLSFNDVPMPTPGHMGVLGTITYE